MIKPEQVTVGKRFLATTSNGERHKVKLHDIRRRNGYQEYVFAINGEGWPFESIEDFLAGYQHLEPIPTQAD
ncbi:hypothetical protein [Parvibium lacunae]|uniref:Uncharacterized protein n=1 Tax=Parvibium lacunae TaxID=1888893 RepID=A0A368L5G3_9BURK|nr:hypothetical protein [Parvibium lacunae]RCS58380.1 hypothetical protein DU000_06060 [Parvibium lacunae]